MTQETRFSRIAVTADDEDDFVIEAGAPQAFAQAPAGAAVAFEPASAVEPESAAKSELGVDSERADDPELAPAAFKLEPEPALEPKLGTKLEPEPAPALTRKSADAYETTLEDLDSVSMSGVQKAVIAIAILAVVAFVAFQFLA